MRLLKNTLAIFGVLSLALSSASDLGRLVTLSRFVARIVDDWSYFLGAFWAEICTLIGIPVVEILARPFSVFVGSLALAVSSAVSISAEREALLHRLGSLLRTNATQNPDDAGLIAKKIDLELDENATCSVYDDKWEPVPTPFDSGHARNLAALAAILGLLSLYTVANTAFNPFGLPWVVNFFLQFVVLFFGPWMAAVYAAEALGVIGAMSGSARALKKDVVLLRAEHPALAEQLDRFSLAEFGASRKEDGTMRGSRPLLDGLVTKLPYKVHGRRVGKLMADRAVAVVFVLALIYAFSSIVLILEAIGAV